jgi:hypothetical protein
VGMIEEWDGEWEWEDGGTGFTVSVQHSGLDISLSLLLEP